MSRGLQTLLESATPTLVLAAVVLLGGMGYGFYQAHQAPAELDSTSAAAPASTN